MFVRATTRRNLVAERPPLDECGGLLTLGFMTGTDVRSYWRFGPGESPPLFDDPVPLRVVGPPADPLGPPESPAPMLPPVPPEFSDPAEPVVPPELLVAVEPLLMLDVLPPLDAPPALPPL
jgi:hypothetical protein